MPRKDVNKRHTSHKFRFNMHDRIGTAAAEQDSEFLEDCFIETGHLKTLSNCGDVRSIVVGRTGSGKTALLTRLSSTEDRAITVDPESLALSYISNSTILKFFDQFEVNLDIFFRLLWRHVFAVELIKRHFKIRNESDKNTFRNKFRSMFSSKKESTTLDYVEKWGSHFWKETEYRIKEVTTNLENDLESSIKAKFPNFDFGASASRGFSQEERAEIIDRAQEVVNKVQIRELSKIIDLIDELITDPQKRYFIVIDRLDEDWIEDRLRYRLIRALIETVKDFHRIRNAKIVVALRLDLLERVFHLTRNQGFQEEKYSSLYLPINWTKDSLIRMLDARIEHLVKRQYAKQSATRRERESVKRGDLLPKKIHNSSAIEFILDRTIMRPRDVITFFNYCIANAADKRRITVKMILEAEGRYSKDRLTSLTDEWKSDYPELEFFVKILKGRKASFSATEISQDDIAELCLRFGINCSDSRPMDSLSSSAHSVANDELDIDQFRIILLHVFYRTGLIGLKLETVEPVRWAMVDTRNVIEGEISDDCNISVHPMYWRALGIKMK